MDLRYTREELDFREKVRQFFRTQQPEHLRRRARLGQNPTREDMVEWHQILDKQGWVTPHWPVEWGGTDWTPVQFYIYAEELLQAPALATVAPSVQVSPVLLAYGSAEQKREFLPRVGALGLWFCQGFSEPDAGSDLVSLRTSAVRDGDHYIVNGCKTWVAYAHRADWMYALVRTDPTAPKHKGISYLLIDMKSPGVTVRPIDTLDGVPQVSEVRLDNVRVPVKNRIGEENKGWQYARHTLGYERLQVAKIGLSKGRIALAKKLAETVIEDGAPLSESRRFRERLALLEVELKALELTNMRLVVQNMREDGQHKQDPKVLVLKIKGTEMQQMVNEVLLDLAGPYSIPKQSGFFSAASDEAIGPDWAASTGPNYFQTRARSITAGSNEIQRNIMAKKLLGL